MLPLRVGAAAAIGVLALVLTLMGLYGIIAFLVTERAREIGLRMALGATRRTVIRSILAQGGRLAGVAIGLALAALGSAYGPARRAARIDPVEAIRADG